MSVDGVRSRSRALVVAVGLAATGILTAVVLTLVFAAILAVASIDVGVVTSVVLTLALTAGVAFGGTSLVYVRLRGLGPSFIPVQVPSIPDLAWIGGGYLLALLSVVTASAAVAAGGGRAAPNQLSQVGIEHPEVLLLIVPASLLLIGPGEELLFRGLVQGTLREAFGPAGAILLAAAIFASVHFLAVSGGLGARLTTIAILFFPSLVFGTAYERTENLVVPALIHGLYNSTLAVLLYIVVRFGGETPQSTMTLLT